MMSTGTTNAYNNEAASYYASGHQLSQGGASMTLPTTQHSMAGDSHHHHSTNNAGAYATSTSFIGGDTTTSYEQSRRQVSSVVVSEELLGSRPEPSVKYVEVEVHQEVVREVPVRTVVDREVIVPKIEYEYVDRIVEVPEIHYVDKQVDVPVYQDVIKHVPIIQYQTVPKEVIVNIPKIEYVTVEKTVEVPGGIIEVPRLYDVQQTVEVLQHHDKQVPVVVAQTIRPVITESAEVIDVDVYEYEPQVIPVEIQVAKPVASHLTAVGATQEMHQIVTVPAAQYNTILKTMNAHLSMDDQQQLPYMKDMYSSQIHFLSQQEMVGFVPPMSSAMIHPIGTISHHQLNSTGGGMMMSSSMGGGGAGVMMRDGGGSTRPIQTSSSLQYNINQAGGEMIPTTASARSTSRVTVNNAQQQQHHHNQGGAFTSSTVTTAAGNMMQQYPVPPVYPVINSRGETGGDMESTARPVSYHSHAASRSLRKTSVKASPKRKGCNC